MGGTLERSTEVLHRVRHVIDIVPTIYEAAGITPPVVTDGVQQKPLEGVTGVTEGELVARVLRQLPEITLAELSTALQVVQAAAERRALRPH